MIWAFLAIVIVAVIAAAIARGRGASGLRQTGKAFRPIVGESNYQLALRNLAGKRATDGLGISAIAVLVLEDSNAHDANAVRVDIRGRTVGYLSRSDAIDYRQNLAKANLPKRSYQCGARIAGGGKKNYGVWIDLPDKLS